MVRSRRGALCLHRFYVRLGFERVERRKFGNDDCYVYRFDRTAWDRAR